MIFIFVTKSYSKMTLNVKRSEFLFVLFTYRTAKTTLFKRYMKDVYDREWVSYGEYFQKEWSNISTALEVNNSNKYLPPKDVLINAATVTDASAPFTIVLPSGGSGEEYYLYAHFAEIQDLQANDTREFNISLNGEVLSDPIIPKKLDITTVSSVGTCQGRECLLQLTRTSRSTLPPLINALEIFTSIRLPQSKTDENDGMLKQITNII